MAVALVVAERERAGRERRVDRHRARQLVRRGAVTSLHDARADAEHVGEVVAVQVGDDVRRHVERLDDLARLEQTGRRVARLVEPAREADRAARAVDRACRRARSGHRRALRRIARDATGRGAHRLAVLRRRIAVLAGIEHEVAARVVGDRHLVRAPSDRGEQRRNNCCTHEVS
jgi:hypothetical protein